MNLKNISTVAFVLLLVSSMAAISYTGVSFAVLDRTLGHADGVDDTVKDVGDDVSDVEHDLGDSVDNAGENIGDILRSES